MKIENIHSDHATNIALDTIKKNKQLIIFVNSKRNAEAAAEKISKVIHSSNESLDKISKSILSAVNSPTKQCIRLAETVKKGIAFHHAGLNYKQRELIEDGFRAGVISVICATPTLAQGLDMPAYRVIIRDLKRFGQRGMTNILVLEYEQMAGRAGRPGKEDEGEAITIAKSEKEKQAIVDEYIYGIPENINSKLGVEPVLRIYVLSLITGGFVNNLDELKEFFSHTFYASQYGDLEKLYKILDRVIGLLREWKFLEGSTDFVSANNLSDSLKPTLLGIKVSELYLDPLTANNIINQLGNASDDSNVFSFLFMICSTLEMRPYPSVRMMEYETLIESCARYIEELFIEIPDEYDEEYEEFLRILKLTLVLYEWIEETGEDKILEHYNIRPGELKGKLDLADWLIYSSIEINKLLGHKMLNKHLNKLRERISYGVREELLKLVKLSSIGKIRARKLYSQNIKTFSDIKNTDVKTLNAILGKGIAKKVLHQLGKEFEESTIQEKLKE